MESRRNAVADWGWQRYIAGNGSVTQAGELLTFTTAGTSERQYTDAQIDDYQGLPRRRFRWRPPLTMTVRARFSHAAGRLRGTAGFGFWNDPFMMTGMRWPALPRTIWFFYASAPSNIRLDPSWGGHGWKAAVMDAARPAAVSCAPLAPFIVPLMNIRPLYRRLWPPIQRALRVREAPISAGMTDWHVYVIEWDASQAQFTVDGEVVLADAPSPHGPLGFVMWLDNQYMVVTPQGCLRWGLLETPDAQWMQVDRIEITSER